MGERNEKDGKRKVYGCKRDSNYEPEGRKRSVRSIAKWSVKDDKGVRNGLLKRANRNAKGLRKGRKTDRGGRKKEGKWMA